MKSFNLFIYNYCLTERLCYSQASSLLCEGCVCVHLEKQSKGQFRTLPPLPNSDLHKLFFLEWITLLIHPFVIFHMNCLITGNFSPISLIPFPEISVCFFPRKPSQPPLWGTVLLKPRWCLEYLSFCKVSLDISLTGRCRHRRTSAPSVLFITDSGCLAH